jgi:hypothetical protein
LKVYSLVPSYSALGQLEMLWNAVEQKVDEAGQKVDEAVGAVRKFTATLANEVVNFWSSPIPESCLRLIPVKDASGVPIGPGSDTPIKSTTCKDIDLCVMLDSSGSIELASEGSIFWCMGVEKELAVGIIKSLGSVRNLLVVQFADDATDITMNAGNISQAIADIRAAPYTTGGTNIPVALRKCRTAVEKLPRGTAAVGPVIVLITMAKVKQMQFLKPTPSNPTSPGPMLLHQKSLRSAWATKFKSGC